MAMIEARVIRTTERAVLLESAEIGQLWAPRSVIRGGDDLAETSTPVVIEVARWWCEKELPESEGPAWCDVIPF